MASAVAAYSDFIWHGVRLLGPTSLREAVEAPMLRGPYGIIHRNTVKLPVMRRVGVPTLYVSLDRYMEGRAPGRAS